MVIRSWGNNETQRLFDGIQSRRLPLDIQESARRKLMMLNAAENLQDLRVPPGNKLEKLIADRAGDWSIRINKQWRICFKWDDDAYNVEIVDYHD